MYKNIDDIPTYNYYQCYFGNLKYIRTSFLDKLSPKPLLKRAFNNIKKQISDLLGQDQIAVDLTQRANLITLMRICADASRNMIFATEEQKEALNKELKEIGLTSDLKYNIKIIEKMIRIYDRDSSMLPKEDKKVELESIYQLASDMSTAQNGRDVNVKVMPIAEFISVLKKLKRKPKNG